MIQIDLAHPLIDGIVIAVVSAVLVGLGRWWGRARRDQSSIHKLEKIVSPWFEEPGPGEEWSTLPAQVKDLRDGQDRLSRELVTHMQQEEAERQAEAAQRSRRQREQDRYRERADMRLSAIERRLGHVEDHLGIGRG